MKKNLIILCTSLLCVACSTEDVTEDPFLMKVVASLSDPGLDENTYAVRWSIGDTVGLYSDESTSTSGTSIALNLPYIANNEGYVSNFSADQFCIVPNMEERVNYYYSYYPYNASAGNNYRQVPFMLPSTQIQGSANDSSQIDPLFFYWASASLTNPIPGSIINFNFNSLNAIIKINFVTDKSISALSLSATDNTPYLASQHSSVNLENGETTINEGSSKVTLLLDEPLSASTTVQSCYLAILAGDHSNTDMVLSVTTSAGIEECIIKGQNFERGHVYSITPEMESQYTFYSINIADVDFNTSYVHYAYDVNHRLIAMITKEYLGIYEDAQAVLVYGTDNEGNIDDSQAVVAQITKIKSGDNYVTPNEKINGGRASYDDYNFFTYENGSSPALTVLYASQKGNNLETTIRTASSLSSKATITPYTLSLGDYDYSIVKIGRQYWTAENLRTTKYADVTTIPTLTPWAISNTTSNWCWTQDDTTCILYNAYTLGLDYSCDRIISIEGKICPTGWRIPTANDLGDWDILYKYAKNNSTLRLDKNNLTLFSAILTGRKNHIGTWLAPTSDDFLFWTGTNCTTNTAYFAKIIKSSELMQYSNVTQKACGFAVRLVKK